MLVPEIFIGHHSTKEVASILFFSHINSIKQLLSWLQARMQFLSVSVTAVINQPVDRDGSPPPPLIPHCGKVKQSHTEEKVGCMLNLILSRSNSNLGEHLRFNNKHTSLGFSTFCASLASP